MGKWRLAGLAASLAVTLAPGLAEAQGPLRRVVDDVKHVGEDVLWVWTSPVRGDQRGWIVAGATGLAFAALLPLDEPLDDWVKKDTARGFFRALSPVRKGGALYGGSFLGPIAGAAYVAGVAFDKPDVRDAIAGCGASWFANSYGRKNTVYRLAGRARPSANRGNNVWLGPNYRDKVPNGPEPEEPDSTWHYRSFPGGHISNVMACASFFGNRFEWGYVEPALYAFAAAVGIGRFPDRAHWLSDQVVGAVFGYAVGKAVADQQLKRKRKREAREAATAGQLGQLVEPRSSMVAGPDDGAFRIGWRIRF
jgi:membrane-associated phospholipid phosphatase